MVPDDAALEERVLRDAVCAGDDSAWRALYDRCFDSLYRYTWHRTGRDAAGTEDAVQECWLIAVRRIRAFDPARGGFEGWLRGIANNVLRSDRRRRRLSAPEDPVDTAAPAEERGVLAEEVAFVLSGLPSRFQDVLRAKYAEELPVAEIAFRRGESRKAVESLLSRARGAFREAYDRRRRKEA